MLCYYLYLLLLIPLHIHAADFLYKDFNETTGLTFVGSAFTSTCEEQKQINKHPAYDYNPLHGLEPSKSLFSRRETLATVEEYTVQTSRSNENEMLSQSTANFGHRDSDFFGGYKDSPSEACGVRLRLTKSEPFEAGSAWRSVPVDLLQGFVTEFEFQVTNLSKACTLVKDNEFSTKLYESCAVQGGDGFAFVIQGKNDVSIGKGGSGLGYENMKNSLALEFDTWYNPDKGDILEDHIALNTGGNSPNSAGSESQLIDPIKVKISDGNVHRVKLQYYPYIKYDLVNTFRSKRHATNFMKDNFDGYRLGTLAIWMDSFHRSTPIVSLPINLSTLFNNHEQLRIGFTASTGRAWQTQDITYWSLTEGHH